MRQSVTAQEHIEMTLKNQAGGEYMEAKRILLTLFGMRTDMRRRNWSFTIMITTNATIQKLKGY